MDIIKLYNSDIDIQPSVMLHHFLRYLGFYVEEVVDDSQNDETESIADIYIISNGFMDKREEKAFIADEEKTILILKDDWNVDEGLIRCVNYDEENQKRFLMRFTEKLAELLEEYVGEGLCLLQSDINWREIMQFIAEVYADSELLQASLFTRCFYKQNTLYHMAMRRYGRFTKKIEDSGIAWFSEDFIQYVLLYAKYEVDLICKKNHFENHFDAEDMLQRCDELLEEYSENEELQLLRADILFELQDKWLLACDRYAEPAVGHCAYADYKRGKIFRSYLEEYDNAKLILKRAIRKNRLYYNAWYQLGECYETQGDYTKAIEVFEEIYKILKRKYKQQLLAPMEMEYLYKGVMKIAAIYKTRMTDYTSAAVYNELAMEIRGAHAMDKYIEAVWDGAGDVPGLIEAIYKATMEHMNIKLEKIY